MTRSLAAFALAITALLVTSMAGGTTDGTDPHAHHRAMMKKASYQVSDVAYDVPDVTLLDSAGKTVSLRSLVESGEPVALNFIFTTCTTICPVMTVTFSQTRNLLGTDADRVHFVSISIDPEYDRPDVLDAYADQFHANGNWTFLTGSTDDIVAVLRSFDSYSGAKMNHKPVTLLKNPGSTAWVRIDGLANGESLANEVRTRLLNQEG